MRKPDILFISCQVGSLFKLATMALLSIQHNLIYDLIQKVQLYDLDWFDSLRPINNLSVKKGRVFLVLS